MLTLCKEGKMDPEEIARVEEFMRLFPQLDPFLAGICLGVEKKSCKDK